MRTLSWFLAVAMVPTVLAFGPVARGADERFDVERALAGAKAKADYEAIAAYFEKEAFEAQTKATKHWRLAYQYRKVRGVEVEKWHLDEHCAALARGYEKAAAESAALGLTHRQIAKEAGGLQ